MEWPKICQIAIVRTELGQSVEQLHVFWFMNLSDSRRLCKDGHEVDGSFADSYKMRNDRWTSVTVNDVLYNKYKNFRF